MKQLLLSVALLATSFGFGQSKITLTLNGLSDEANAGLQKGELLRDLNGLDRLKHVFFAKVQNTSGGSTKFVKIKEPIRPNENGKYDFSIQFDVEKTGSLDFSKEIMVIVEGKTTFGNDVWVEQNIAPADFSQPIVLNNYGSKSLSGHPPQELMKFTFSGPRPADSIAKLAKAKGDAIKDLKYEDFHLQAKNVGGDNWVINDSPVDGYLSQGRTFKYRLDPKKSTIDITKPVMVRISAKTEKGAFIWNEWTLETWELGGNYFFGKNYSEELTWELPSAEEVAEDIEEVVIEEVEEVITDTEVEIVEVEDDIPAPTIAVEEVKCAVDTITKQLYLDGGKLCVQHVHVSRGTTNTATLLYDTEYELDGVTYALKGGKKIQYHNKKNFLLSADLAEAIVVNHSLGQLALEPNHVIEFSQEGLYAVKLSKNASINYKGNEFSCKSTSKEFDIEFDKLSHLRSLTLANEASWTIAGNESKLPADSYLTFKKDELQRVELTRSTEISVADKNFTVVPAKKGPAMQFKPINTLESFTVGEGHTTNVDGQEISIKANSEIVLNFSESGYSIKSVVTSKPVTMEVQKGSKVKSVDVKAGKRLIIEEGKVVKVK